MTEYIHELAAIESIRASGKQEYQQAEGDEQFVEAIHASTRIQLELRSQIAILQGLTHHLKY